MCFIKPHHINITLLLFYPLLRVLQNSMKKYINYILI